MSEAHEGSVITDPPVGPGLLTWDQMWDLERLVHRDGTRHRLVTEHGSQLDTMMHQLAARGLVVSGKPGTMGRMWRATDEGAALILRTYEAMEHEEEE